MCSLGLQRLLHDACPSLDKFADTRGEVVRQHVGDPDQPTAALTFGKNLDRRVVVRGLQRPLDHRVDKPTSLVVNVDKQLACHRAAREGDDPGVSVEASVDEDTRHEALMHRADIANRRPNILRACLDQDFLVDGSHLSVSSLNLERRELVGELDSYLIPSHFFLRLHRIKPPALHVPDRGDLTGVIALETLSLLTFSRGRAWLRNMTLNVSQAFP